jgi:hypothetical protein
MKTVILLVVVAFSCGVAAQEPKPKLENKQATQMAECDAKMSESECDRKIQQDLASAIRENPKECSFEPDWRPTHVRYRTLHVNEVNGATMAIAIDGKAYTLRNSACQGHDCSRWKPEVGMGYSATIIDRPKYINPCLHRELPARRELWIDFGKMKQETLPQGIFRTPEFEVSYSVTAD